MLTLLLSLSLAQADDARYALVRLDAKLCEAAKDDARCITVGVPAEPGSVWRDPFPARVVEEDGDWVLVDTGAGLPAELCRPPAPLPGGVQLRVWVKRADLVPATVAPMSFTGPGGSVALSSGVPTGVPYRGQQGATAPPFLGSIIIAPEATGPIWAHAAPTVAPPANAKVLKTVASIPLDLGAAGNGSVLPGIHSGVIDEAAGTATFATRCSVVTVPTAGAAHAELKVLEGGIVGGVVGAAPDPATLLALPAGTALSWESGKPAGTMASAASVPRASVTTKGKLACAAMPLGGIKDRTVALCFAKDLAAAK